MKNKTIVRLVHSLIVLPAITFNPVSFGLAPIQAPDPVVVVVESKAKAIDSYFAERGMPMAGLGEKFVKEAEKNDLDWRLLAAIAVRESTGGKFACQRAKFNGFGWGSCKIDFDSHHHAIERVAVNLGGNNPKTSRYYADKNTKEILRAYNPPSIVPRYAEQVIDIMDTIGPKDLGEISKDNA